MAVGTVSGVNLEDQWQLISSVTASGTSITFNSLSGYKHLWLVVRSITKSGADYLAVRPNNDSTAGNYAITWSVGTQSQILFGGTTASAQAAAFRIYNIDQAAPHKIEGIYDSAVFGPIDTYANPVAVTSLVVYTYSGATFTGGTVALYGIAA
jgi:hypothetical protein